MCWLFHKWTRWEQYTWHGIKYLFPDAKPIEITERREKRNCLRCGREQDRKVMS